MRNGKSRLIWASGAWLALALASSLVPREAAAGKFEISLGFSFSRSNYAELGFSWNRRWGATLGYHFNDTSEIETSFMDVTDRAKFTAYQDTTFHDQITSLNWIQSLLGRNYPIQPFLKAGVGQLNREASGSYETGGSPPLIYDALTGVLGAGFRLYFTRQFAIRTEVTSYLAGGSIRTWRDNAGFTVGSSFEF